MTGKKNYTWIRLAPIGARPKPARARHRGDLTSPRVRRYPAETIVSTAPLTEEKKIEVKEIEEELNLPLTDEVKVIETPQEAEITGLDKYVSHPEERSKKSRSFSHDVFPRFVSFFQWRNKVSYIALMILTISFVGGISVVGLLQSTENVGSSGILIETIDLTPPSPPPPPPAPPEPSIEIDIYSDSGCTVKMTEVIWGSIEAGSSKDQVVYVKNAGDVEIILILSTDNWVPTTVAEYMDISWDYDGTPLEPGDVLGVTLTLSVEANTPVLGEFSFDIIFVGSAL